MTSCTRSINHVNGYKDEKLPHYFVEVTLKDLNNFEILNSICLLDNFDQMLYFLESQINTIQMKDGKRILAIPSYDVLIVLITLATVSEHSKEQLLRASDPYNFTRIPLNKKALSIIEHYLSILKNFDTTLYAGYDLELLRCQFFLMVDNLLPKSFNQLESITNPYTAYFTLLKQKETILGNRLLNVQLAKPSEFLNLILLTLSYSLEETEGKYLSFHERWGPMMDILTDLISLRHKYYMKNEIAKEKIKSSLYTQRLSESPLACFFKLFNTFAFKDRFTEYIFIGCNIKGIAADRSNKYSSFNPHTIFKGEDAISTTYVARTAFSTAYKVKKSMRLRRRIINKCFKLLSQVPKRHRLVSPRMDIDDIITNISITLSNFSNLMEFFAFFDTESPSKDFSFLPVVAENTLNELLFRLESNEGAKEEFYLSRGQGNDITVNLVSNLSNTDAFLKECLMLLEEKLSTNDSLKTPLLIQKSLICILSLLRFLMFLNDKEAMRGSLIYTQFLDSIANINIEDKENEIYISPMSNIINNFSL
ncbi:hypothetical protein KAFR_0C05560 [Kazachstania africana CBS 2517]|uniref:Uncharacterized protein n=1 Tax=Kazachstania africana (strain ATCC 22294 / BCRC 22015 / CBS 2517 / CECT 1963 / NBRC 1671 / NRRL Y-8276) TaxID=1071382 RepID=H2AT47_KAZAF|nr:hypothetical protein KAFR_0C05560 [Kazachstania africana CBS 2517]CCF57547.1 hypothetical protein KAFR_0C05560 [Kazachstania africana CBS 2517]